MINSLEAVPTAAVSSEVDCFQKELTSKPAASTMAAAPLINTIIPERVETCTPFEAIMAGRGAAGCDFETNLADEVTSEVVAETYLEFLCFRVSDEIYGINIMDIKEIIKPREVTEVPRAPVFVSGVLSLRGTIIPIIDMRVRLDLARQEPTGKERIVVIKNNNSFSGLMVDEVTQVVQVQMDDVEAAPAILDGIDRDFVSGLGRSSGQLIIILNLENIADISMY
ncbi:MAG: chemotaxis protein CheW [Geobacteraceae bacterium]|nr:chemotaxis protein CheW [Geobacteraceae bacterium]NTW80470.1 chemotaxis protein CheW [Geobacteraceae bacterium]